MKPLTLYDFLRVGHVKRWHNVNTIRQQTVAEHSYMVTIMAMHMAKKMGADPLFVMIVAAHSLFHDSAEVVLGDTPTPAKRFIRSFTENGSLFDDMEKSLMPGVPYISGLEGALVGDWARREPLQFVKVADRIEAAHWISENGAGNHAEIVKNTAWRNLEDYVEKIDEIDPASNWYGAVNEVLMALGMRYVHKQSRITPP